MVKQKAFRYFISTIVAAIILLLSFFVFAAFCVWGYYAQKNGFDSVSFSLISDYIFHPSLMIDSFYEWLADLEVSDYSLVLWAPCIALGVVMFVWTLMVIRFVFWREFNVYASTEDVREMGLFDGAWMLWGKKGGRDVQIDTAFTALAWGEKGVGKTSSVAVPSILESDTGNIMVVEETGTLAKLTSGYRASIGTVFNFDLDESDEPLQSKFYARWNPLSFSNIPAKGSERDEYIAIIARNLLVRENDYWGRLIVTALDAIITWFVDKVEQAVANDYFVDKLLSEKSIDEEDVDILISHYATMPKKFAIPAISNINEEDPSIESYLPIGSWNKIPEIWQGKELNLAMISDCLLQLYLDLSRGKGKEDADIWKEILEHIIKEAKLLGYDSRSSNVLEYLFYLSRKQRKIVFTLIMGALSPFGVSNIRERTSVSDFTNEQLRGIQDINGNVSPTTVYVKAASKEAKSVARFMLSVMGETNIKLNKNLNPVAVIVDDFEKFGKINNLGNLLDKGGEKNVSFLLIGQDLQEINDNYTTNEIEEIVSKSGYKIFMANDDKSLIKQLEFIASYASKTIQIPVLFKKAMLGNNREASDAYYYLRVAKYLKVRNKKNTFKRGIGLIFAEGFYYLPIKVDQLFYQQRESLRNKAKFAPIVNVDELYLNHRNMQDVNSPSIEQVLDEINMKIKTNKEVNDYMREEIESVNQELREVVDKESMLTEDISSRWKSVKPLVEKVDNSGINNDWWMEEDAFEFKSEDTSNPFKG